MWCSESCHIKLILKKMIGLFGLEWDLEYWDSGIRPLLLQRTFLLSSVGVNCLISIPFVPELEKDRKASQNILMQRIRMHNLGEYISQLNLINFSVRVKVRVTSKKLLFFLERFRKGDREM